MGAKEAFWDVEAMLLLAGLPKEQEVIGKDIVFEGQALDPIIVPGRMNLGKVKSVDERGVVICGKCYYYLILMTDRGMKYTYCGFGDFWHFELAGKIYVGKITALNGKDVENG